MAEITTEELFAEIGRLRMHLMVEQREKEQAFSLLMQTKTENDELRSRLPTLSALQALDYGDSPNEDDDVGEAG